MIGPRYRHNDRPRAAGFSLAEALIAISIVGLASASLLMSTQVAFDSTTATEDKLIADGLMAFLSSEISGQPYHDKAETAFDPNLGPETGETTRADFDDIDDFNGFTMFPITDEWNIQIGTDDGSGSQRLSQLNADLSAWRATFAVTYADYANPANDLAPGNTSGMRAVTIAIDRLVGGSWVNISTRRQIFTYVPTP